MKYIIIAALYLSLPVFAQQQLRPAQAPTQNQLVQPQMNPGTMPNSLYPNNSAPFNASTPIPQRTPIPTITPFPTPVTSATPSPGSMGTSPSTFGPANNGGTLNTPGSTSPMGAPGSMGTSPSTF